MELSVNFDHLEVSERLLVQASAMAANLFALILLCHDSTRKPKELVLASIQHENLVYIYIILYFILHYIIYYIILYYSLTEGTLLKFYFHSSELYFELYLELLLRGQSLLALATTPSV